MMTGVTHDHAHLPAADTGHGLARHRPSILEQFGRLRSQLQLLEEFIMAFQDELDRLKNDVTTYVENMRAKVQSLQDQITQLQGQVSTATTTQMNADAQSLSDQLDQLETALSQDNQPTDTGGGTPAGGITDTGTGSSTDTGTGGDTPPSARRR